MQRTFVLILTGILLFAGQITAQDTLPSFTVVRKPFNRNVISWTNHLSGISQISIQRSSDSLRNFKTIMTVPDPKVLNNGFVDTKGWYGNIFYRLFIVFKNGDYLFGPSKRPASDQAIASSKEPVLQDNQRVVLSDSLSTQEVNSLNKNLNSGPPGAANQYFVVSRRGMHSMLPLSDLKKFRDSIVFSTRDTIFFTSVDSITIKPYLPPVIYRASRHVYTEKTGNVMISLPDAGMKKYSISFFEEDRTPLFEIEEVKSKTLIVDKTNFIRSGWFWFELFENGTLKERHRLFIPRDF